MSDTSPKSTVLVVEDETLVRMHGTDTLRDAGYQVLEAANADEAIALLREHGEVVLLFSDIDMPGSMDGLKLATMVHERWPNIRLLLTSGHQHPSDAEIPDAGRFMRKPWGETALIQRIRDMLSA